MARTLYTPVVAVVENEMPRFWRTVGPVGLCSTPIHTPHARATGGLVIQDDPRIFVNRLARFVPVSTEPDAIDVKRQRRVTSEDKSS